MNNEFFTLDEIKAAFLKRFNNAGNIDFDKISNLDSCCPGSIWSVTGKEWKEFEFDLLNAASERKSRSFFLEIKQKKNHTEGIFS